MNDSQIFLLDTYNGTTKWWSMSTYKLSLKKMTIKHGPKKGQPLFKEVPEGYVHEEESAKTAEPIKKKGGVLPVVEKGEIPNESPRDRFIRLKHIETSKSQTNNK